MAFTLTFYKLIAAILIFITTLAAVIYPIRVRALPRHNHFLELGDAFASGIFLGAALFHLLPDAINQFAEVSGSNHYPIAELLCAFGFLVLLFLERISQFSIYGLKNPNSLPYMLALILIIHALIEGTALGINTTFAAASVLFFAIIAHKSSESFALAIILNRSQLSTQVIIFIVVLFSLMTPLGIAFGTTLSFVLQFKSGLWLLAGFNAFAAGTFLYMSTLHHINHHERQHEGENLFEFIFLTLGLIIMAIVAWWA